MKSSFVTKKVIIEEFGFCGNNGSYPSIIKLVYNSQVVTWDTRYFYEHNKKAEFNHNKSGFKNLTYLSSYKKLRIYKLREMYKND